MDANGAFFTTKMQDGQGNLKVGAGWQGVSRRQEIDYFHGGRPELLISLCVKLDTK